MFQIKNAYLTNRFWWNFTFMSIIDENHIQKLWGSFDLIDWLKVFNVVPELCIQLQSVTLAPNLSVNWRDAISVLILEEGDDTPPPRSALRIWSIQQTEYGSTDWSEHFVARWSISEIWPAKSRFYVERQKMQSKGEY